MSEAERQRLATKSGVTVAQATTMTGADLAQKALLATSGQSAGPGKDAAALIRLGGSS